MCKELRRSYGENNIININQKICRINTVSVDEKKCITLGTEKTARGNKGRKTMVPSAGSLFVTVQGAMKMAYEVRIRGVNEPNRLVTVNRLKEGTMQEIILDI